MRPSGREPNQMRAVSIERHIAQKAEGSCLVSFGNTKVLVTASVETSLPGWLRGKGQGWVTAEYGMLPRATGSRTRREATAGKQTGRTQEIQRLIGRSLRAVVDMQLLGENQITVDCDVLEADGGTRTAAITGAYVAACDAVNGLIRSGKLTSNPVIEPVAAVSVGVVDGVPVLDLEYVEDSACDTDMNVVMTGAGRFIEVQGTAEGVPFSRAELDQMLALAEKGILELQALQAQALAE